MLLHAGVFLIHWVRSIDAERSKLVLSVILFRQLLFVYTESNNGNMGNGYIWSPI